MLEEKISIIIPVYNNEKYLERCIVSLINQTYKNLEIILINDGSTDNSRIICEKYLKKDKRVILVNQKNGGVSAARNKGIEIATGSWIAFVDSDDWITENMYEILHINAIENNADISIGGYIRTDIEKPAFESKKTLEILDNKTALEYLILDKEGYATSVWNKLYKIDVVKNILFDKTIKYGEDLLFNFNIMMNNRKNVVFDKNIYYIYFYNRYSATNKYIYNKSILTELNVYKFMLNKISNKEYEFLKHDIYIIYQNAIIRILLRLTEFNNMEGKKLYYQIRKAYKEIFRVNSIKDIIKLCIIFSPYKVSGKIYKLLRAIRGTV